MARVDLSAEQGRRSRALSRQAVAVLLVGVIVAGQSAWLGLIAYGAWRLLFGAT